jgi:hypothetical protein
MKQYAFDYLRTTSRLMKLFLAGIMQGSHLGAVLHNQNYREQLKTLLREHLPQAEIYDPLSDHADSLDYDADRGRAVFLKHNRMCRDVDVLIAFVPEASMGTAIEMWEAHTAGRIVLTISPMSHNWAVRFLSDKIYPDFETFAEQLAAGQVARDVATLRESRSDAPIPSPCGREG